jgi:hypothetical protein
MGQIKVVLIGHKARQGKDTFASMLKEEMERRGENTSVFHFADPLKEIVSEALGVSRETLDALKNENGHYREILQRFGSGKMKDYFGEKVWKELVVDHIRALDEMGVSCVIIPDFRFPAEYIDGAISINVVRPGVWIGDEHISETAMDLYEYDKTVVNDLDLEYLQRKAREIGEKIIRGML